VESTPIVVLPLTDASSLRAGQAECTRASAHVLIWRQTLTAGLECKRARGRREAWKCSPLLRGLEADERDS
jgi:hypothetical protein